jgi:adenine deaminase
MVFPTLSIYEKCFDLNNKDLILHNQKIKYMHPNLVRFWLNTSSWGINPEIQKENFKKFVDYGGKILLGTDCTCPNVLPGFSVYEEMYNMIDMGLSPFEVIKAGTFSAAEHLGILNSCGTIEEGKIADFILLNENPLTDLRNIEKRDGVFVNGAWYGKNDLEQILNEIEKKYINIRERIGS